ncbi:MAG: Maf family protein [Pseudomonadota bacterium]
MTDTAKNRFARTIALASGSPRRRELLQSLGLTVVRVGAEIDETRLTGEPVTDYVARLAREKAASGRTDDRAGGLCVVAGDTAVATAEQIHDKPLDLAAASTTLRALSGQWHEVHTSVAVDAPECATRVRVVTSRVKFRDIQDTEITAYWETGEPADKAGAYGIQGLGGVFVERIEGSYSAVMGLPVFETAALLAQAGVSVLNTVESAQ